MVELRELEAPPALAPLYAKALVGTALPGRPDEVPDYAISVPEIGIDGERRADYARVCCFTVRDSLPPTYPHVLGFPVAMAIMSERTFPFSLLGLVHIANRIEQSHPVPSAARPGLRVWAENLRPHRRGRQLDMVTEVTVDGRVAWREHSTYLRPGEGSGERRDEGEDPLAEASASAVWSLSGDLGRRYAGVSGDRNPIHLNPLSARVFGFPGMIAHGMWTLARSLASLDGQLPPAHVSTARFRAPVPIPGRVRLLTNKRPAGWDLGLESLDGEHRHLEVAVAEAPSPST
jgi:acyl dehydratase